MSFFLGAVALLSCFGLVVLAARNHRLQTQLAEMAVQAAAAEFEVARLTQHAEDLLVPLTWTWDHIEDDPVEGFGPRLRAYLLACYAEIQKTLLKDDVEMTEILAEARSATPPRRLPRYPQTPPYLARVEDVVSAPGVDLGPLTEAQRVALAERYEALPKHGFDVVTTPQGAEAHHGAPPKMPERYFVQRGFEWVETDVQGYDATASSRYLVSSGASPESVPEPIRALIWAPPRAEMPEPVALDDE